jgi:ABC-type transport system involved in multi-copper enzyme maturation permease subunit
MFGIIVKKEILHHILSFRFLVVFLLLIVLLPGTVLVLTNDYVRKLDDYSRRQAEIENYLGRYAHFNRIGNVIAPSEPPLPFQVLIRGISADINSENFDNDPLPVMFPLIDLTFIAALLLSLAGLILSYDAVSGEREDGTLKLMLANGLPRFKMIAAKIVGGAVTLLIPFLVSLGIGMILILANPRISWSGSDWGALGLVLAGIVVYVFLFYCLGVLISARHAASSSSIMTSLFVWVVVILIVPNLSPFVASVFQTTPSRIKISREVSRITQDERDDLGQKLMKEKTAEVVKAHPLVAPLLEMSKQEIQTAIKKDPRVDVAYTAWQKAVAAAWQEANAVQGAKAKVLRDDQERKEKAQTSLSVALSQASPLASFTYLATNLSGTGIESQKHFDALRDGYERAFWDFAERRMADMKKKDPTVDVYNTPVDVSDRPRFEFREQSLGERFQSVLRPFVLLIGMALAVFFAGVLSFNRYDVR